MVNETKAEWFEKRVMSGESFHVTLFSNGANRLNAKEWRKLQFYAWGCKKIMLSMMNISEITKKKAATLVDRESSENVKSYVNYIFILFMPIHFSSAPQCVLFWSNFQHIKFVPYFFPFASIRLRYQRHRTHSASIRFMSILTKIEPVIIQCHGE